MRTSSGPGWLLALLLIAASADAQRVTCGPGVTDPSCICTQKSKGNLNPWSAGANDCPPYYPGDTSERTCCRSASYPPTGCWYSVPQFQLQLGDGRCCDVVDPYATPKTYQLLDANGLPSGPCPFCGDKTFDTSTQCCINDKVIQKNPIQDLSQCPNRVPHPGHVAGANGCGPAFLSGVQFMIPHGYKSVNFTEPCDDHDRCYDTCNNLKSQCDLNFYESISQLCKEFYDPIIPPEADPAIKARLQFELVRCQKMAQRFMEAVSDESALSIIHFGQKAYDDAQKKACDCCD